MASLTRIEGKRGTTYRIEFSLGDNPKRKYIRLGKVQKRQAESIKTKIELLISAKETGTAPDPEISRWVAERDEDFHRKLSDLGLVAPRKQIVVTLLGEFLDSYIDGREKIKPSTRAHLRRARASLVAYFGADKPLHEITPGDGDDFREQLTGAENTVRRICGRAKQFFRAAARKKLIPESPFADMKGTNVQANRSRDYFVTRKEAEAVLDACPDSQWKLLFALCRYGGLRCPSEPLAIRWSDVDLVNQRIRVDSPKTGPRVIPIFPELRPYVEAVYDGVNPGIDCPLSTPMITRYRDRNANLRTQLTRIIKKAKLTPWPKLFQNLRATRETELINEGWKIHQVCAWIGNSEPVAMEHYLQVTEADYAKAAGMTPGGDGLPAEEEVQNNVDTDTSEKAQQNAQQKAAQDIGTERKATELESENPDDWENRRDSLEPLAAR